MPYLDPVVNFGKVTLAQGYSSGATSIAVVSGEEAKLPATSAVYNLVWWNSTDYGDPSDDPNKEIVRVTSRTAATLTVTRAQEGTTAVAHDAATKTYKLALHVTKKTIDQIEAKLVGLLKSGFRAHPGANQVITSGVNTVISADNELWDFGAEYSIVTFRFTATTAGKYHVEASLYLGGATVDSTKKFTLGIRKNNTTDIARDIQRALGAEMTLKISALVDLAAGDFIECRLLHDLASSQTVNTAFDLSWWSVHPVYQGAA